MNKWAGTAYGLSELGRDLSTGNILDVSARGSLSGQLATAKPAVTRDCPNRGRDLSANSSAANLDVAPQQEEHPTKAVTYADGTGVVANRKPSIHTNSDTHPIRKNSITYRGVAVSPAAPQVLDVADQGKANSLRIGSLCVGDEGVSDCGELLRMEQSAAGTVPLGAGINTHPLRNEQLADSQILDRHGDDRFADNIQRALEGLPQNGDAEEEEAAAEEGAAIENSGYRDPAENVRFA